LAIAASVSSRNPLSFSVSVWSWTWKSSSSATEAGIDRRRHRAPVLVDLEADAAAFDLVVERTRLRSVAAAEEAEIDRPLLGACSILPDVERRRRNRCRR
jgi:hypothetical protein